MTNPKDDSGQIKRKGHGKRVISLLNDLNNCHIKMDKIRQQTAQERDTYWQSKIQEIFERVENIGVYTKDGYLKEEYERFKQKYLDDKKELMKE